MLPSDITKMAQSFSDIAEGKDKDDSYLETDMKKRRKNNEKAVEDMKKVKDDTVPRWMREKFELVVAESYYYKRLKVMSVELAERFLDIAEGCIVMGYESPKLIDNIAEALDKDIVGHDFRAALGTVNPHLNENAQTAGRKQAKAVAMQISEAPQKPGVYGQVGGLEIGTNPGKNQDLGYRAGRALTNMGGDLVKGVSNQLRNIFTGTPNTAATNPAAARNNQRLKNIGGFLQTGQLPGSGASTSATPAASTTAAAPAKPQRGQGGRTLGSTTQRQGGAVTPTTANAPAAPKPTPTAPAKPAPTAATKPFVKQTGNKAADMATWAKANPKLAAKVKPGQAGYETIQKTLNPPKPAATSFNPNAPKVAPTSTPRPTAGAGAVARPTAAATPAAKPAAAQAKADTLKKSRLGEGLQSEGIVDAIKKVATKVLEPADNSPAAKAARMGARRPQTDTEKKVGKKTAEVLSREEFDNFDLIQAYLIDEGVTEEEALTIMTVMEDDQREEILEVLGYLKKKAGEVVRDVKDRVTGKKELVGGGGGYIRVGGPTKKGDTRVSGIGPVGTYARDGMYDGSNVKSHTQSVGRK